MALEDVRRNFFQRFPDSQTLDRALQSSENLTPSFFMSEIKSDGDLKGTGFALLRLGPDLERRFGVNGEVAAYFVRWSDFQRRSYNAITLRTPEISRNVQRQTGRVERFTPNNRVALLISPDPNIDAKIDEWQQEANSPLSVIPVSVANPTPIVVLASLTRSLRARLGDRDLYRTQNPVTGREFFGRSELLRDLTAAIQGDENVAILGLRRSGKTSVIQELKRQVLRLGIVIAIADFQMLDDRSIDELAESIASNLLEELKRAKSEGMEVWVGNEAEQDWHGLTLLTLSDRLKRVAARNPHLRIVIAVDEVEGAAAIARVNPTAVRTLLGSLRSAAQARSNVSLLFSGVVNRLFQSSSLGEMEQVDNPIFGQVSARYLKPFDSQETASLLRELGKPMLLGWSDSAVGRAHELTGGFPFFARDLASLVREYVIAHRDDKRLDVTAIEQLDVDAVAERWAKRAGDSWMGMIKALELHYAAAAALLDPSLSEDEIREWLESDQDAREGADDLIALGLFQTVGDRVAFTPALNALRGIVAGRTREINSSVGINSSPQDLITALIASGESHTVEFKETARINTFTSARDVRMEDEITKTVAGFLNADGGVLLVGVSDSGEIRGIDPDLKLFKKNPLDGYERWLRGDLLGLRIDKVVVGDKVAVTFVEVRGKRVLRVDVAPSERVAWVDDKVIYRRNGNQTIELTSGREMHAFLAQRITS